MLPREKLGDEIEVDHHLAGSNPVEGVDESGRVQDAILEQVSARFAVGS